MNKVDGEHTTDGGGRAWARASAGKLQRLIKKIWWFHSLFALSFGVGVMLFARHGLAYADKLLMVLFLSWLIMFVALRFIVGPANRSDDERFLRKGLRLGPTTSSSSCTSRCSSSWCRCTGPARPGRCRR
ncbi:MAG: hypothetical protein R3B06_21905 [Kofleriaceae bacterium]